MKTRPISKQRNEIYVKQFNFVSAIFIIFQLENFVNMEIFLWAMCWRYSQSNEPVCRLTKPSHRHWTSMFPIGRQHHIHLSHQSVTKCVRVCVASVWWNSFICIQRTKICYCFFRFNFPFGDFLKWEFLLRSIHYYHFQQRMPLHTMLLLAVCCIFDANTIPGQCIHIINTRTTAKI